MPGTRGPPCSWTCDGMQRGLSEQRSQRYHWAETGCCTRRLWHRRLVDERPARDSWLTLVVVMRGIVQMWRVESHSQCERAGVLISTVHYQSARHVCCFRVRQACPRARVRVVPCVLGKRAGWVQVSTRRMGLGTHYVRCPILDFTSTLRRRKTLFFFTTASCSARPRVFNFAAYPGIYAPDNHRCVCCSVFR